MKFLPLAFLLFVALGYSQPADSLKSKINLRTDSLHTFKNDSLAVPDSLKEKSAAKADTLIPIYQMPLYNFSGFIDRHTIDYTDYRYTGDLLKNFSFSYTRDFGFIGQPNETLLYGLGFNGISYFQDGVLQNNRLSNSLDLNDMQSEFIDSIEVIPLTRGFLYGPYNNPVSVNFLSRDFISAKPYSRIKYYQGPDGEALIDVLFNEHVYKKINISFDITNRKYDSSYVNSAFSQWAAKVRLKYFMSDNVNLIAGYDFVHSNVGLNGGVNYDSTLKLNSTYFSLYQNTAPVYFPFKNLNTKFHHFNLRLLGNFWKGSKTDLTLYYYYDQSDLNQTQDSVFYKSIGKNKIFGAAFREDYGWDIFNLNLNSNFESGNIRYYSLSSSYFNYYPVTYRRFTLSAVASAELFDSTLVPSVYYKYTNASGSSYSAALNGAYSGAGADITYRYTNEIKFYAGFSSYKTGYGTSAVNSLELSMKYSSDNISAGIKYFKMSSLTLPDSYGFLSYEPYYSDLSGIGLNLNCTIWKLDLETVASFYHDPSVSGDFYLLPKINFTGGIYYKDSSLFNSNLNLKAGFVFYFNGRQKYINDLEVNDNWKLDFTAAGEIHKTAIVYFTWENLFDRQYYLIPYYPMPQRGIRFGIAWVLFN